VKSPEKSMNSIEENERESLFQKNLKIFLNGNIDLKTLGLDFVEGRNYIEDFSKIIVILK
jgi:hypothetical protein